MSLLPIVYTSLAIFFGTFITILIISYISYKIKSGRKDTFTQYNEVAQAGSLVHQKKLAQVPVYNINQGKHYQKNNYQSRKRVVQSDQKTPRIVSQPNSFQRYNEKDYERVASRPRIQVVKRLSRLEDEPMKLSIRNTFSNETSLYRYYAQG